MFASELKCFSVFKDLITDINDEAIYEFLLYQYFIEPKTPFKKIAKIPSGCYINLNLKNLSFKVTEYWSMEKIKAVISDNPFEEIKKKIN